MSYTQSTKVAKRALVYLLTANLLNPYWAMANPADPKVIHGQATFITNGNQLNITNTSGTVIDWGSFSIDSNEITRFNQQNAASVVLNRITGQDPSQILGSLQSNGKVVIINPNGILFGQNARVDVNGLTASSLNISNQDVLAKKWNFEGSNNAGKVQNDGTITTPSGGQVYLIAPNVENNGLITTPEGEVILAAGHKVQLVDSADPSVQVVVSASENQAVNLGRILAQSGSVGIYGGLINQRGTVNANSAVVGENGKIVFKSSDTTLLEAGSITSATGAGTGGEIQILGDKVGLVGDATVDASGTKGGGTVLIGGDYHGDNANIQNAKRTFFGSDASIKANALESGDGGKVVVWADERTRAYGSISAQGGSQSGNGGFVETSGKQTLDFHSHVNVGALNGKGGTLLLDPQYIFLYGGAGDGGSDGNDTFQGGSTIGKDLFGDSGITAFGDSFIYQSELEGLAPGTNIILEATSLITAYGDFDSAQLMLPANSNLTLHTRNDFNDSSGFRGIDLVTGVASPITLITSGTGTVTIKTGTGENPVVADILLPDIKTAGGAVTIEGRNSMSLGAITSAGGAVTVEGWDVSLGAIASAGGAIDITASKLILQNDITAGTGIVSIMGAAGIGFDLGSTLDEAANTIELSNTELNLITARELRIFGGSTLNVSSSVNLANITKLGLYAQGAIAHTGSATVAVNSLELSGHAGINLNTATSTLFATNSGTSNSITINNTGPLTVQALSQSESIGGNISLQGSDDITVAGNVTTNTGSININAHNVLTIDGSVRSTAGGNIILAAGTTGSVNDKLTLSPDSMVTSTGAITLNAGDAISVADGATLTAGATQNPFQNTPPLPSLSSCIANPSLSGCSSVLPSLSSCIANPSAAGCSVVLPSLSACISNPAAAGCSVVLPTLSACTVTPSLAGCSVVLPSVASCVATPTLAGCSVVLPSLAACISNPATAGCSVVLPTLSACSVTPSLAGCSVVLPSLASCVAAPTLAGCSVVLPSLNVCVAAPGTAGCSVVLPSVAACISNPTTVGCSAVLPSLATCISNPASAGCSAVLPGLAVCTTAPSTAGCTVVLPSLATCISNPASAGCSAVLPNLAVCTAAPSTAGCTVVLPSLATCISNPASAGCSTVLPSLAVCAAAPSTAGCTVVLPSLATCISNPASAGCSAILPSLAMCVAAPSTAGCTVVLPSLATCISNPASAGCSAILPRLAVCVATPSTAGCSVVLPTLAQCTATPTLSGCSVVLPPVNVCLSNPSAPGCAVVLPPVSNQVNQSQPVSQAINSTVNIINTVTQSLPSAPAPISASGIGTGGGSSVAPPPTAGEKKDEKKDDKQDTAAAKNTGVKTDEPVKKLYCN